MKIINARDILFYLLKNKYEELDFEKLNDIEYKIFNYNPFFLIDLSQDALYSINEHYPETFEIQSNIVRKAKNFDKDIVELYSPIPYELENIL